MGAASAVRTETQRGGRRAALHIAGTLWRLPGSFGIARALGPSYSLRCVLFHDISDVESPFTRGLNVTTRRSEFEAALQFLTKHYTPVRLGDVLYGKHLPPRPVLVTFDDTYASVAEVAAPLCRKYGVPAAFFVNASCLDNRQLALDNLVCSVTNAVGMSEMNRLIHAIMGSQQAQLQSMAEIFSSFLPNISLERRQAFQEALLNLLPQRERDWAEAGLYLTSQQLQTLVASDFEIGNHTYTHVHCRCLSGPVLRDEIDRNKAELESVSGSKVRSFSLPYGSRADLTDELAKHLGDTGHQAVFLSESVANSDRNTFRFDRVSARANNNAELFGELEVLPRLRAMRNLLFQGGN